MPRRDAHRSMPHAGPGGNDTRWSGGRLRPLARRRDGRPSSGSPDEDEVLLVRVDRRLPGPDRRHRQRSNSTSPASRRSARRCVSSSREEPVVLDLGGTTFLDVSGIALLIALSAEAWAAGAWFGVLPRVDAVARVLDLTGLRPLVSFAESDGQPPPAIPRVPLRGPRPRGPRAPPRRPAAADQALGLLDLRAVAAPLAAARRPTSGSRRAATWRAPRCGTMRSRSPHTSSTGHATRSSRNGSCELGQQPPAELEHARRRRARSRWWRRTRRRPSRRACARPRERELAVDLADHPRTTRLGQRQRSGQQPRARAGRAR